MFVRIFLILYVIPLMALSAISMIFGKTKYLKQLWIGFTLIILSLIVLAKMLFSILGLIE